MSNPFSIDSKTGEVDSAHRLGRPSRSIAAYRDVSDEALQIAQEWHDEATSRAKEKAQQKIRLAEWEASEEGQKAREEMSRLYRF